MFAHYSKKPGGYTHVESPSLGLYVNAPDLDTPDLPSRLLNYISLQPQPGAASVGLRGRALRALYILPSPRLSFEIQPVEEKTELPKTIFYFVRAGRQTRY